MHVFNKEIFIERQIIFLCITQMLPDCSGFMGTNGRLATKAKFYSEVSSLTVKEKSTLFHVSPSPYRSVRGGAPLWSPTQFWASLKFLSVLPGVKSSSFQGHCLLRSLLLLCSLCGHISFPLVLPSNPRVGTLSPYIIIQMSRACWKH